MDIDNEWLRQIASEFERRTSHSDALDSLLMEVGLDRSDLTTTDRRVDAIKENEFFQAACDALEDMSFAAKAGATYKNPTHILGYITKCSENLREAIESASRFSFLVDETLNHTLKVSGNHASMEVLNDAGTFAKYHRRIEFAVFAAISQMRSLTDVNFYPLEIHFKHHFRSGDDRLRRLAGCPVYFGAEKTEILLSHTCLELPIPTFDPNLRKLLTDYSEKLLSEYSGRSVSLRGRIEGAIMGGLPGRIASADEVAAALGLGRRSFARRLKEQDLSFRNIVDSIRADLAQTYLKGGYGIGEVAFYLDYADQAAFSTAFKRWTGATPSAFKARNEYWN